jgi:acyl-coenzyme A synthetase/AMP-(fatty) acid ligase
MGYRTGDMGYADDEGFLYLVGRLHDMIKVGAHRVGVKEIEDALCMHASVHEAAVVAAPHPLLGEVPVAFVTLRAELVQPEDAIRAFCAAHMASHKVPQRVTVVAELPRLGSSGKVDKRALKDLAAAMPAAPGP